MVRKIAFLIFYSVIEFLFSRISYFIVGFSFFSFLLSVLVSIMAVGEEGKVLSDFLSSSVYLSVVIFSVIWPSISINQDVETKRIYLIFSKGFTRAEWLVSKIISFYITSFLLTMSLSLITYLFLRIKSIDINNSFYLAILFAFIQSCVMISISSAISIITSSYYSSFLISAMIWILSHFSNEIKQSLVYATKMTHYVAYVIYLFPDFSSRFSFSIILHYLFYSSAWILLGIYSFNRKEI